MGAAGIFPDRVAVGQVQESLSPKIHGGKMACADGIQECIETVRDLKSCNAEEAYLNGLYTKIDTVEHRAIVSELGTAVFVVSASLVLKLASPPLPWLVLFCSPAARWMY